MKFIKILVILIIFYQIGTVSATTRESYELTPPIPIFGYFTIEKTFIDSELPNIGMTYVWYNVTIFTKANRDVNLSNFYFSVESLTQNKNFTIEGEKNGKVKFPIRTKDIAPKGEPRKFIFRIMFREEGEYNLHLYQGLDLDYPLKATVALGEERGVTLANILIVSPLKYTELKYQKDLAESSKISAKAAEDSAAAAKISAVESAKITENVRGLLIEYRYTTSWTKILAFATCLMAIFTFLLAFVSHINTTKQIEGQHLPDFKLNVDSGVITVRDYKVPKLRIANLGNGINKLKLKISDKNKILREEEKETLDKDSEWSTELDSKSFTPTSENLLYVELNWKSDAGGKFYKKWKLKIQVTEEHDLRLINDPIVIRTQYPWDIWAVIKR